MHHPPRILIVDDNEANRDILARGLRHTAMRSCTRPDGEEALACRARQPRI